MHYTIVNCGGTAANVVSGYAEASMYVRSYSRTELDGVVARVKKVLQGAAMMTETEVEIIEEKSLDNKIPVLSLNELVMEQAEKVKAPCIRPARQKTGSTDFGNVMRHVPGTCIRVAFVPEGSSLAGVSGCRQDRSGPRCGGLRRKDPGSDGRTAH